MSYTVNESVNRCLDLLKIEHYEEAILLAEQIIQLHPTSSKGHLCQIMALYYGGFVSADAMSVPLASSGNTENQARYEVPLTTEGLVRFLVDEHNSQVGAKRHAYYSAFIRSIKAFLKLASPEELEEFKPFYRKIREEFKQGYMKKDLYFKEGEEGLQRAQRKIENGSSGKFFCILLLIGSIIGALCCGYNVIANPNDRLLANFLGFLGLGGLAFLLFCLTQSLSEAPSNAKRHVEGYERSVNYFNSQFPEL